MIIFTKKSEEKFLVIENFEILGLKYYFIIMDIIISFNNNSIL